ncbi:hypothetical protein POV27_07540 [Aureisphaera galaxeae]|uniref:hypothetical protein n=1 Tax=Aureisphaera galaxeae TaxID=1538023 RepID=UPI0023503EAA|nr:hypothetical protein [Aureisphaera galaxeae]MDC8003900.1 hypothetical protein [Aureisphaera galaxeae]
MDQKITLKYIIAIAGAVLFTWVLHEFMHWVTAELLGYDSIMRLNSVSTIDGGEHAGWDGVYTSASGPLITILQATVVFLYLKAKGWNKWVYPLLFVPFYMRLLAGIMNFMMPNDEGRIGEFLGIGLFTISIVVSGFLFFLVYKISRKYALNWKFHLWTTLWVLSASSTLIMVDQFFSIRIL